VGETVNIGRGSEISINELARLVGEVAGRADIAVERIEPRPGDVLRLYADTTKARRCSARPEVTLRGGLQRLKDWYLAQGKAKLLEHERVRNWQTAGGFADD
jgi:UDP-glucose 4-epimerase